MQNQTTFVEWIVKTALQNETITTNQLIAHMQQHHVTSGHLLQYIDDDRHWYKHDHAVKVQDEKYVLDIGPVRKKNIDHVTRESARTAVYNRFYTGHKFGEWLI